MDILKFIFPPACGICGKIGSYICKDCYEIIKDYFYKNSETDIFYLLEYKDIVRDKMIAYKFNEKAYLHNMFCEIFVKNKLACEFIQNYDIIIPVPMYKSKKSLRGYNQCELMARDLADKFNLMLETDILLKNKSTKMQSSLGKVERTKNVQGAYKINYSDKIKGKNVVLLDDIYTTGATIKECKKMLKLSQCNNIGTIIIAKD